MTKSDVEQMKDCVIEWRRCAAGFREQIKDVTDKRIIHRLESIVMTFEVNARILEAYLIGVKEVERDENYTSLGILKQEV